jgi:hypothetical protein
VRQTLFNNVATLRLPAGLAIELPESLRRDAMADLIAASIQDAASVASQVEVSR